MEKQNTNETIRPTKKQKELLSFIEDFISEHGYSPSYREIMKGMNYNSASTVALHVNSLLKRGHLKKRDHSARSLEVTSPSKPDELNISTNYVAPSEEKWLIEKVEHAFKEVETAGNEVKNASIDQLYVLVGALKVLGFEGASQSFIARLSAIKQNKQTEA